MKRLLIALVLVGCTPEPTTMMPAAASSSGRFRVERVEVIRDDLAYGARRGVYVLLDTKTGREYVGVSGVGIADVGSHPVAAGKVVTSAQDER